MPDARCVPTLQALKTTNMKTQDMKLTDQMQDMKLARKRQTFEAAEYIE